MAKAPLNLTSTLLLNSILTAAITTTTAGSEKTDSRLASWKSGLFAVVFGATDVASGDEVYTLTLEGRETASAAYTVLATITTTVSVAVVNTIKLVSVPRFMKRLRVNATLAGTTPSLIYSAVAICTEFTYQPDAGTVITA